MSIAAHAARAALVLLLLLAAGGPAAAQAPLYMMTMPPHVIDQSGRHGMVGDVVLEAMRRAGVKVTILVEPNPRAMAMVKQGENAFITALSRTPERESSYTWVAPIMPVHRAFYSLTKKVDSFAQARRELKLIAVSRNTANAEVLLREGFDRRQLVEVNAGESAPRMLVAGHVDAWFNLIPESEALLSQVGAPPVIRGQRLASADLYLACSKACSADSVRKIGAALAAMKADGTTRKLIEKYAGEPGYALD